MHVHLNINTFFEAGTQIASGRTVVERVNSAADVKLGTKKYLKPLNTGVLMTIQSCVYDSHTTISNE